MVSAECSPAKQDVVETVGLACGENMGRKNVSLAHKELLKEVGFARLTGCRKIPKIYVGGEVL